MRAIFVYSCLHCLVDFWWIKSTSAQIEKKIQGKVAFPPLLNIYMYYILININVNFEENVSLMCFGILQYFSKQSHRLPAKRLSLSDEYRTFR